MEQDLTAALLGSVSVAALIGDKFTWMLRPQGSGLPAATAQVTSDTGIYQLAGRTNDRKALVQFDCWAATLDEAIALADAIMALFDSLVGTGPWRSIALETRRDSFQPGDGPDADHDIDFYCRSLDVRVWHRPVA